MKRWIAMATLVAACGGRDADGPAPIRFLHTFSPDETELVNAMIAERGLAVEGALVPFARGQQVIHEILRANTDCPDLIRIDATWLPGLASYLSAPPANLGALDWTSEGFGIATVPSGMLGVPQTV
ncbi:MAG: hypothetical protein ABIY55_33005, partial [Kofleriaceae bacterium]